jgi:hypothetical protein
MHIRTLVPNFRRSTLKRNVAGSCEKLVQVIKLSFRPKRLQSRVWYVNPIPEFGRDLSAHAYPKFIPSEKMISFVISTVNTILSTL